MKIVRTVKFNAFAFVLTAVVRKWHENGDRIVWDFDGSLALIPPSILEQEFAIVDAWTSRKKQHDQMPSTVGVVTWTQTVKIPVSATVSHDPPEIDKET